MITEFLKAAFLAGIPVGLTSFCLIWWALRSGYFEKTSDMKQLEKEVSMLSRAQSNKKKHREIPSRKLNPVHNKWVKLGGGFYGVVAMMTLIIVEIGEIVSFLGSYSEIMGRISGLSLDLLINFFIDQMMNVFMALAWPWYWIQEIRTNHIWVWFLAAYGGYWLGARAALHFSNNGENQS